MGLALLSVLGLVPACSSDSAAHEMPPPQSDGGVDPGDSGTMTAERSFEVSIENISADATMTTPLSPGVFATHGGTFTAFAAGGMDRGEGLQRIAEDGNPVVFGGVLGGNAALLSKGVFDTPVGDSMMGPATPGKKFVFTVKASPTSPNLSFATMFGQSNDWFFAPDPTGIPLFDPMGQALAERDVSDLVYVWDVGSEINQAPSMGPDQGPRQAAPDTGPAEGVLSPFTDTTRSLPSARAIAALDVVAQADGTFTVTVKNVSGPTSSIVSPISPVFYAVHDSTWTLFAEGQPASAGLEALAEDGNGPHLAETQQGAQGTSVVGAAAIPAGSDTAGPALPGSSFSFTVKPDASHRFLSIASMVGQTNDAFLAFGPKGVALLDEMGKRPTADLVDDFARALTVWDAGTEANQVPGVGMNQAPRQPAPNTGPADPQTGVRRYADATNDLAKGAGGVVSVEVSAGPDDGHLTVTITNNSNGTAFPGAHRRSSGPSIRETTRS